MKRFSPEEWQKAVAGYKDKQKIDALAKKNMDAFVGDVCNKTYLPKYSSKEVDKDFEERLKRASNNYFNFPSKIMKMYQNALFRSTEPDRESNTDAVRSFWKNSDGTNRSIQQLVKEEVFILNQVHGGCLVVVDKPEKPVEGAITRLQQERFEFFPYAYVLPWDRLVNFGLDRYKRLEWILLKEASESDDEVSYKLWDKTHWRKLDANQDVIAEGEHGLGVVPVVRSFNARNPKYEFQQPIGALDQVVKISLKAFELMSQLDQMVIAHVFLKIAMPENMFKKIKSEGMGVYNVLVYDDNHDGVEAHYVDMPSTEMNQLVELIFERYPHMILEFASIRAKTDKPREESGLAKTIDSSDELNNLIDKAEAMESVEQEMTDIAARWENVDEHDTTISYSKNFDVKSIHEQLEEMVSIFKQDLHAPTFAREIVKRVARKMLGNVSDKKWLEIQQEIDDGIDPALSLEDIDRLINVGALNVVRIAKRYNPELAGKSDEEVQKWVVENLDMIRAVPELEDINAE